MSPDIAAIERYSAIKSRLEWSIGRMHYNLAGATDLDGLDRLATTLERVLFHGDRVALASAQGVAAEQRRAERAAAAPAAPTTRHDGYSSHGAGVSAVPHGRGGPLQAPAPDAPQVAAFLDAVNQPDRQVASSFDPRPEATDAQGDRLQATPGLADSPLEDVPSVAEAEVLLQAALAPEQELVPEPAPAERVIPTLPAAAEPSTSSAGDAPAAPFSPPAPPLEPLVVKQKPPVSKPGRKRGYVYKGKAPK